jgi:hypothetical protein
MIDIFLIQILGVIVLVKVIRGVWSYLTVLI